MRIKKTSRAGFTMTEVLVATLILVPVFVSVIYVFIQGMMLSDMAKNSSEAIRQLRSKMAEIENTAYANINANYDNVAFATGTLNGRGVTYVDNSQPNVLTVTATICWREKGGRIVGEDKDIDGQIDAGEDANANNMLESPVTITTVINNS